MTGAYMTFTLEQVVPWGRNFEEYVAMFALSSDDLQGHILGCSDGPAGFNSMLTQQGGRVISVDPIYGYTAVDIRQRVQAVYPTMIEQVEKNMDEFVWDTIPSLAKLGEMRLQAMETFLADYDVGRKEGRYREASLPNLPFADHTFDLALCSHFLFLYSEQFSAAFHVAAIQELCRVAQEVRIFPLLELGSKPSRHVDGVLAQLRAAGYTAVIQQVPYEFQRGGNQMLRLSA